MSGEVDMVIESSWSDSNCLRERRYGPFGENDEEDNCDDENVVA